jgi:type II secretory pathway component HofQ
MQDFTPAEGYIPEQQDSLEQELAVANAQLASALATARQVLSELVLGQEPGLESAQALQAELSNLSLEEALSEVVYQVQEKLVQAAAAAEAATAAAEAATAAAEQQLQQRAPLAASSRASSLRVASPRVSEQLQGQNPFLQPLYTVRQVRMLGHAVLTPVRRGCAG